MCYAPLKIKSTSTTGVRFAYVPCGKCEECRNIQRHGWSFRLQSELEYRQKLGWKTGFLTLTYSPENLPKVPEIYLKPGVDHLDCFDRLQVREFIKSVRKWLHRHYGVTELVYMICSEYGKRGRPHYHLLCSWPSAKCLDKTDLGNHAVLDAEQMHRVLCHFWTYGYKFPQYAHGGFDGSYYHKPFEVDNVVSFAAKYCSKYVCKDLAWNKSLNSALDLSWEELSEDDRKILKNCCAFHIQSRSLGWSLISNMSDEQKLDLVIRGHVFPGAEVDGLLAFEHIPLYIRNKLFFDVSYIIDSSGKRVVRRDASHWFDKYYQEIFQRKVDFYDELVQQCMTTDFWMQRLQGANACKLPEDKAQFFASAVRNKVDSFGISTRELSERFVAWFGVPRALCYDMPAVDMWYSRYKDYWYYVDEYGELKHDDGLSVGNDYSLDQYALKSDEFLLHTNMFWYFVFDSLQFVNGWKRYHEDVEDIQDYYRTYLDAQCDGLYGYGISADVQRPLLAI